MTNLTHLPVLLNEVLTALALQSGGLYLDGTLGAGGHSEAILRATAPDGRVLGLDRDAQALDIARERLQSFGSRLLTAQASFSEMQAIAQSHDFVPVHGILLDLGLSSLQLGEAGRGFSLQADGPLDMRFDQRQLLTAADIVNHESERELADIIYRYGEEPRSRAIAREIVRKRPIQTTDELARLVARAVRAHGHHKIHPATRTFQALRIAVNDELALIEEVLPQTIDLLRPGGRLAIIAFHSLEDRLVKQFMRAQANVGTLKLISKKPISASDEEIERNPRSRSAKLRVAERL